MRWRSWLRHCATSRKVAGSIPDGVIGIFHWHNPSGRAMALELTQPLTEMSTRNNSWGVKTADALGWQPYHLWNLGASTSWNPTGLSRPVMGLLYLYLYHSYLGLLFGVIRGTPPWPIMQSVFSTSAWLRRFVVHVLPQRLGFHLRLLQCKCELWWTKWQWGTSSPRTSAFTCQYQSTDTLTLTHQTVSLHWHSHLAEATADTHWRLVLLHILHRLINWCYKQVDRPSEC
jgi:hypothetical protein